MIRDPRSPWFTPRVALFSACLVLPLVAGYLLSLLGIADSVAWESAGVRILARTPGSTLANTDFPTTFLYPYEIGYLALFLLGLPMALGATWAFATRNHLWGKRWMVLTGIVTLCLLLLALMARSYMLQVAMGESYTYGSPTGATETGWAAALFGLASLACWIGMFRFRSVEPAAFPRASVQ